jgi:hypothetical protein
MGAEVCGADGTPGACACPGNDGPSPQDPPAKPSQPRDAGADANGPLVQLGRSRLVISCPASEGCWRACAADGGTADACLARCGRQQAVDCWLLCHETGGSASTCQRLCGSDPGCGAVACWATCGGLGATVSTCVALCGSSQETCGECRPLRSARSQCWQLCQENHLYDATCTSQCGPLEGSL